MLLHKRKIVCPHFSFRILERHNAGTADTSSFERVRMRAEVIAGLWLIVSSQLVVAL